jgi:hypothetical protein
MRTAPAAAAIPSTAARTARRSAARSSSTSPRTSSTRHEQTILPPYEIRRSTTRRSRSSA